MRRRKAKIKPVVKKPTPKKKEKPMLKKPEEKKAEEVVTKEPAPSKSTPKEPVLCECGKPVEEGTVQCYACAHRA